MEIFLLIVIFKIAEDRFQIFNPCKKGGVKFNDLFLKLNDLKETLATSL